MILKPIISEKTMKLAGLSTYTFSVEKQATKPGIAKEVEDIFKVNVLSVRTINVKGKVKWQKRARKTYTLPNTKRAIVTLKTGQIIPLFEASKQNDEDSVVVTRGEDEPMIVKEKKNLLGRTKVKIEKGRSGVVSTTQRKVITGK